MLTFTKADFTMNKLTLVLRLFQYFPSFFLCTSTELLNFCELILIYTVMFEELQ